MEDYTSSDDDENYFPEEYADDGYGDNFDEEANLFTLRSSVKVISNESLLAAHRKDIERLMDLLPVTQHHARALLVHCRWSGDRVVERYYEDGGIDKLFAEAGVKVSADHDLCATASVLTCHICIEDMPANQFTAMDCGHYFCSECWTEYFTVKINEGQSRRISCMAHKCNCICNDAKVQTLINAKDPQLAEKFNRFLLESYVEDNKMVKWCPSVPHCGNALRVEGDTVCEVECSCGLQFCFSCTLEAHSPCSCIMWNLWCKKCEGESETAHWITANTKSCPKCHKIVEKSHGCNLVVCICKQPFCWLCGGPTGLEHTWTHISNHSCGRYTDSDKEKEVNNAKKSLHRYLHYYKRYKAHKDSLKLEAQLKETVHQKFAALEKKEEDCKWVSKALNNLFRSRRILTNSYVFAYYMFGDELFKNEMTKGERQIKQNLFENQQQQFEGTVEKLSMCFEKPLEKGNFDILKMQIIDLSVVVGNLCKTLHEWIDTDLLGSLAQTAHFIAPYNEKGVEKAIAM